MAHESTLHTTTIMAHYDKILVMLPHLHVYLDRSPTIFSKSSRERQNKTKKFTKISKLISLNYLQTLTLSPSTSALRKQQSFKHTTNYQEVNFDLHGSAHCLQGMPGHNWLGPVLWSPVSKVRGLSVTGKNKMALESAGTWRRGRGKPPHLSSLI